MLNPSTADAESDDPTIRKCMGFTKRWGYNEMRVVNLFAFRATNPKELEGTHGPPRIGPDNNRYILSNAFWANLIVCAWGARGSLMGRDREVIDLIIGGKRSLKALGLTKKGHPRHPLYMRNDSKPTDWMKVAS